MKDHGIKNARTYGKVARRLIFVALLASVLLGSQSTFAATKVILLGNTIWVSGDSRLTLEMPSFFHPDLRVTSTEAGDFQWISATLPINYGASILGVYICYQTPDNGTFISQIRLSEYLLPTPASVKYDDGTDLISSAGACFFSSVDNYKPAGSVNLELRLDFAAPGHRISLGALAVLVEE